MTNNNIVEKADKVIEKILNELDWDYLSQPARIKLLQTLLPYRLPRLKDSETSLPSLPNKVDIQIIGRKEEPTIDIQQNNPQITRGTKLNLKLCFVTYWLSRADDEI